MSESASFFVKFWGVRGSIACAQPDRMKYGGNTSCLEIRCGAELLIFDAGTGLYGLGCCLKADGPISANLFLTHTHMDHIYGLPFFGPAFVPENRFDLWAGHLLPERTVRDVLSHLMTEPLHPVPIDILKADVRFHDFQAGETISLGDGIVIRTAPLNHPNGATGYRIEYDGKSICYVTDTEHVEGEHDANILSLIAGADVVIYDATFTEAEYPRFKGWGHSTWQEGARLCDMAGVGTYVIFHHAPEHDDDMMDEIAKAAAATRPGTLVAREGMVLTP